MARDADPAPPITPQQAIDERADRVKKHLDVPWYYNSLDNPQNVYRRRPTTMEHIERARQWREQQRLRDPEYREPPHFDPTRELPRAQAGTQVAENTLTPEMRRRLEMLGLPTVPTAALSDLPKSLWNRLMSPAQSAQEVLKSGKTGAESVTGEQSLNMGTALLPAFGRAGGLGAGGSIPKDPQLARFLGNIRQIRGDIAYMERNYQQLINTHKTLGPNDPMRPFIIDTLNRFRQMIDAQKQNLEHLMEMGRKGWGEGFDKGPPTGELGAGGGRAPGGTRGSNFLGASPNEVKRFWQAVDAYRGDWNKVGEKLGISPHTAKARAESGAWPRPAAMATPQISAQAQGMKAQSPQNPTPADLKHFWDIIDRYQHLRNWQVPVTQLLGISPGVLQRRFASPKWARPTTKSAPGVETQD